MIDGNDLINIEQKLNQVKIKYRLSKDIEAKWNSSYKALGTTLDEYKKYKSEVCEIIAEYRNSVVGIIMDKEECYKNKNGIENHNDLYAYALNLLMERFCMEATDRHGGDTNYIGFPNFSESLVFIDSQYSSGIQLADFCAGAIFKSFEDNVTRFKDILISAIRSHNGRVEGVGLKIFKNKKVGDGIG